MTIGWVGRSPTPPHAPPRLSHDHRVGGTIHICSIGTHQLLAQMIQDFQLGGSEDELLQDIEIEKATMNDSDFALNPTVMDAISKPTTSRSSTGKIRDIKVRLGERWTGKRNRTHLVHNLLICYSEAGISVSAEYLGDPYYRINCTDGINGRLIRFRVSALFSSPSPSSLFLLRSSSTSRSRTCS